MGETQIRAKRGPGDRGGSAAHADRHTSSHKPAGTAPDQAGGTQRALPRKPGAQGSATAGPRGPSTPGTSSLETGSQEEKARAAAVAPAPGRPSIPSQLGGQTSAGPPQPRTGWHHHLTDSSTWKEDLRSHFRGIFAKAPAARTARALGDIRQALTRLCKHTPWRPFTQGDLIWATRTWKKGKSTGPDAITHELLWMLLREPSWSGFPTPAHVQ